MKKLYFAAVCGIAVALIGASRSEFVGTHAMSLADADESGNNSSEPDAHGPGLDVARAIVARGRDLMKDQVGWQERRDHIKRSLTETHEKWAGAVASINDDKLRTEHDGFRKTHERLAQRQYNECNTALDQLATAMDASHDLEMIIVSYESGETFRNGRDELASIAKLAGGAAERHTADVAAELAKFTVPDERLADAN